MLVSALGASGWDLILGIFRAGLWVGIVGIIVVVAGIIWLLGKAFS